MNITILLKGVLYMRDQFFGIISRIKFNELYCIEYRKRYRKISNAIIYSCYAITILSFTFMLFISKPIILAALGITAQVAQLVLPCFAFSKRLAYMDYYIPYLEQLSNKADHLWNISGDFLDGDIADTIHNLKTEVMTLNWIFIGKDDIPKNKAIHDRAYSELQKHYKSYYNES